LLFFWAGAWCQDDRAMPPMKGVPGMAGEKLVISKIIIEGNKVTRNSVILRELLIKEGKTIELDSIGAVWDENELRLFNLQLFNEVDQWAERSGDELVWYITVKERWYYVPNAIVQFEDRNINTWWVKQNHDLRRTSDGFTVTDKNFRGNLETLAITLQDGYSQKLSLSYMRPYVNNGQTSGFGFSTSMAQSRQVYYTNDSDKLVYTGAYSGPVILKQFEGGLSYIFRPAYASKHLFRLSYKDYSIADTVNKLNPDYFADKSLRAQFLELFYRYEYNGVDNWNYSLRGLKLVSASVLRQGFEGLNFQAIEHLEAGYFSRLAPKLFSALVFRGRLMWPQAQPYYFTGGLGTATDYMRGYEYYVIDGTQYGLMRLDLKREIFNNTYSLPVRYFSAIPLRIYPKLFADAGYISNPVPGNSFLSNRGLYSYGAGVDVVTFYDIKLRFEYAWNMQGQGGLYLHFNSE